MRTAALTLICFVAFTAAMAQRFTLLPQAGVEISKTKMTYNEAPSFSPLGSVFTPSLSLRLNYAFQKGHGIFLGATTSRSTVSYGFTDPEKGMNAYTASIGNMQVRMEGGYQFTSKPIFFGKSGQASAKTAMTQVSPKKKTCNYSAYKTSCSKTYSSCSRNSANAKQQAVQSANKGTWMKIQPSAGVGLIPGVGSDLVTNVQNGQSLYEYKAGNWNTAFITGASFEFGKNEARLFTLSVNYFKGIGNLNTQTLVTESSFKQVTTTMNSASSGWNMRIGVPLTLGAKKSNATTVTKKIEQPKYRCGQYKSSYRCQRLM